jgi:maleylacetate reductase
VPTTYAGAEWTPYFGIRDEAARVKSGGSGANTVGILYEPALTLGLSRRQSGGTAMNALAHCVEARYVSDSTDGNEGAALIDEWLPRVLDDGQDAEARRRLLEGAMHAGIALRDHGLYLGHAMAQALGGRYGLPHGALNAICLPAAMRFNGATEPIGVERVEELARLCGFTRLRDLEVPEGDLREIAEATAVRGGAQANPRPASVEQIEELFLSIW